jgi:hypothetical protein
MTHLPNHSRRDLLPLLLAALIFSSLSTWAGLTSKGFLEADACTHYQYSRFVWQEPYRLIDVWGRPLCTAIYAIPAHLAGRNGVHIMSLLCALATAWITRRIALLQNYRYPTLAFIFLLAQPLVFLHSFSELTELPFALLVAVAFLSYREKRWWELSLVVGVMPLSRPEGFGFLLMTVCALLLHQRKRYLPLLPIPLAIWSFGGYVQSGQHDPHWYLWLPHNWPYSEQSLYTPGPLLHYVATLPAIVGPFVFPALLLGLYFALRQCYASLKEWGLFELPHTQRCDQLIILLPLLILFVHSYLYWRGKMASNGELRYLLVVAPFWSLLITQGFQSLWSRFHLPHLYRYVALATLAPLWINIPYIGYPVLPLTVTLDWTEASTIAHWYESSPLHNDYPYLINSHPGVPYAMDISSTDSSRTRPWTKKSVDSAPPGCILIWDPIYGIYNSESDRSIPLSEILAAGWIPIPGPENVGDSWAEWRFFLSPQTIQGTPTTP